MSGKVTVKQAAEQLGKSEQFVRVGLQRGILPIGYAFVGSGKPGHITSMKLIQKFLEDDRNAKIYYP